MITNFKFSPFQLFLIYPKHECNIVSKAVQIISLTAELKINIHFNLNENDHAELGFGASLFGWVFFCFVLFC